MAGREVPGHRPGLARTAGCTSATSTSATCSTTPTPCARWCSPGTADHEWAARRAHARGRRGAAGRRRARPRRARALRWRAPPLLAGPVAAGRRRPADPRRADQPPRRRGGGLAGRAPGPSYVCAGGGHPRPLVPRRRLRADLGGPPRRRTARGWSTPTTAGTPPSCSPRPSGSARPPPRSRGGRTSPARSWPGCDAGPPARTSKPKFRIDAANALIEDVPAAARPDGAAEVRHPAARQGRRRPRGRRPHPGRAAAARARDLAARSRATGSGSSASTAPARARCSGLVAGDAGARRRPGASAVARSRWST